jgi:hypothetical protein
MPVRSMSGDWVPADRAGLSTAGDGVFVSGVGVDAESGLPLDWASGDGDGDSKFGLSLGREGVAIGDAESCS